jgi:hypothetical protein
MDERIEKYKHSIELAAEHTSEEDGALADAA